MILRMNIVLNQRTLCRLKTTDLKKGKIKLRSISTNNIYQIYSTNQIYQLMMDLSIKTSNKINKTITNLKNLQIKKKLNYIAPM